MNWEPIYAILLFSSTLITYLASLGIASTSSPKKKKSLLVVSIVLNLSMLFFFKYYNFLAQNITALLEYSGLGMEMPTFSILLPVGISFYIFQALGYSIDVYRGTTTAERNLFTYALFVSFFPQLVAGPIERSSNLLRQFGQKHVFDYDNAMSGIRMMLWGYLLKLVLADRCGIYVDAIFNNIEHHNGGSYLLATILFTFQIYGDFAGYSLTAIGAAKVMGFNLMENFRRPYFAKSVTEFWRRWHISLSTWFRDYVYIPLGGNRVSKARNHFNVMTTFIISGIWHGANWTFLIWGTIHGAMQCIEKTIGWHKRKWSRWSGFFHWLITFAVVCLAWIFFRADSLSDALKVLKGIFTNIDVPFIRAADLMAAALAIMMVGCKEYFVENNIVLHRGKISSDLVNCIYIVTIIIIILLFGVLNGDQFIYFQF